MVSRDLKKNFASRPHNEYYDRVVMPQRQHSPAKHTEHIAEMNNKY